MSTEEKEIMARYEWAGVMVFDGVQSFLKKPVQEFASARLYGSILWYRIWNSSRIVYQSSGLTQHLQLP